MDAGRHVPPGPGAPAGVDHDAVVERRRGTLRPDRPAAIGAAVLAVLLVVYAAVGLRHLDGLKWDSDEGINVSLAWLVRDGYPLYARVWSDHAPGYVIAMAWAFRAFGVSLAVARGLTLAFGLVGLAAAALCAREVVLAQGRGDRAAWGGAWLAATALAVAPNFWWASRAAMIDIPMLSVATLAMGCVFAYGRTGRRPWLFASAAALGTSLWIKYHMVYLAPIALAVVVATERRTTATRPAEHAGDAATAWRAAVGTATGWRPAVGAATAWSIVAALPLALSLVVFDAAAMIEQSVRSFATTLARFPVDTRANAVEVWTWLAADNGGLAALAAAGAVTVAARPARAGVAMLAWGALAIATALRYAPLYIKVHLEPLLFVLAILAGVAFGNAVHGLARWRAPCASGTARLLTGAIVACGLVYLYALDHVVAVDLSLRRARGYDNTGEVVWPGSDDAAKEARREDAIRAGAAFLRAHSAPGDFVVTDHQIVAFHAGRRLPPEVAVINSRAIAVGLITPDGLIAATERYRVPAVLEWDGDVLTSDYRAWVRANFTLAEDLGSDRYGFRR